MIDLMNRGYDFRSPLKVRFPVGSNLQIKPGAYFGYRLYGGNAGQGLGINGSVALQYQLNERIKPLGELGILSQPNGGNNDTDLTYSPVFLVSAGITI